MAQALRRGILTSFNAAAYTASVLLLEATSTQLQNVPVATHIDGTSALIGAFCAVLFFDAQNPTDAVVVATFANGTTGVPATPPGRLSLLTPTTLYSGVIINAGTTQTFTIAGNGGIPVGALAVLFKAYFSSPTVPAHLDLAAHGGDLSRTCSIGDLQTANGTLNGGGVLPLSAGGQIDIKANGGNCTLTFITYGYCM